MSSSWRNIRAIIGKELYSYMASPVAYVFIVVFIALTGFFTFGLSRFFDNNDTNLEAFFIWHPWLYMFMAPALGMRLWAEERRSGTLELLFTLPIMMCFWFFIFVTLGFTGVRAFFVAAMDILYGMPLGLLNTALTGFLLGSALGILAGGVLADRIGPRIVTATVTLVSAGALIVLVGSMSLPLAAYVATLVVEPDEDARPAHERLARRTKHPRIGIEIR